MGELSVMRVLMASRVLTTFTCADLTILCCVWDNGKFDNSDTPELYIHFAWCHLQL